MDTDAFLASPAAQAYREGRYADALVALDELRARYPDDITIKRVRGMTLYNLERYRRARKAFDEVVALDPENGAANFWLGATLFKVGNTARAYRIFKRTISLAPGSPYADQAQEFIDFIDKENTLAKRWSLEATVGLQHDDNVSLANEGRLSGLRVFEQLDGNYVVLKKPGWVVTAEAGGYLSQNTADGIDEFGDDATDFDLAKAIGGLNIRRETGALGVPIALGLNYAFDSVHEGYDPFSDIHAVTASLEANPTPNTVARIYYRFNHDSYGDDGVNPALTSRDGTRHAVGIEKFLYLKEKRHYLWAAYEYGTHDTTGLNFDAEAHFVATGFYFSLPRKFVLTGSAAYLETNYGNFVGPRKRRSAMQTYQTELSRPIGEKLTLSLGYAYSFDDANYRSLETEQNVATVSLKRKF